MDYGGEEREKNIGLWWERKEKKNVGEEKSFGLWRGRKGKKMLKKKVLDYGKDERKKNILVRKNSFGLWRGRNKKKVLDFGEEERVGEEILVRKKKSNNTNFCIYIFFILNFLY